jgi:hypothetical protein
MTAFPFDSRRHSGRASRPVFQPYDYDIQPGLIARKQAALIEKLLKHLVIGTEFNPARKFKFLHPKAERIGNRFSRKIGADGNGPFGFQIRTALVQQDWGSFG